MSKWISILAVLYGAAALAQPARELNQHADGGGGQAVLASIAADAGFFVSGKVKGLTGDGYVLEGMDLPGRYLVVAGPAGGIRAGGTVRGLKVYPAGMERYGRNAGGPCWAYRVATDSNRAAELRLESQRTLGR